MITLYYSLNEMISSIGVSLCAVRIEQWLGGAGPHLCYPADGFVPVGSATEC